jgi:hypothetical protein
VENVIFVQSRVLFVTINVPGGSNNDTDVWYGAPTASAAQLAPRVPAPDHRPARQRPRGAERFRPFPMGAGDSPVAAFTAARRRSAE